MQNLTAFDRFWPKVKKTETCWIWIAGRTGEGYGGFYADRAMHPAHRWLYVQMVGPLPSGVVLDHLCRNRACVNPAHLEPVTDCVNILRGMGPTSANKKKTHCHKGHEFTPANTRHRPCGSRACKTCERDYARAWDRARRANLARSA